MIGLGFDTMDKVLLTHNSRQGFPRTVQNRVLKHPGETPAHRDASSRREQGLSTEDGLRRFRPVGLLRDLL